MRTRPCTLCTLLIVAATLSGLPGRAQEVGRFAVVQNEVTSLKPGARSAVPAAAGQPVVLDEIETSGAASAAKLIFGEGAVISIGQNSRFGVTREAVAEVTGQSASTVDLFAGKMRVFVSRFWSGRPEVRVNTPTAVVGVKGSEVVLEVLEDGTTRVTVITGGATVQDREPQGTRRELGPTERAEVGPAGGVAELEPASPSELEALWSETEAWPTAPRQLPEERPVAAPAATDAVGPGSPVAINTAATSSAGSTLAAPATTTVPENLAPRNPQEGIAGDIAQSPQLPSPPP